MGLHAKAPSAVAVTHVGCSRIEARRSLSGSMTHDIGSDALFHTQRVHTKLQPFQPILSLPSVAPKDPSITFCINERHEQPHGRPIISVKVMDILRSMSDESAPKVRIGFDDDPENFNSPMP